MPKFYSLIPLPSWTSTLTKQEIERHLKFSSIDHLVKLSANFKKWLTQILNNIKIPKTKYFLLLFSHNFPSTKMRKERVIYYYYLKEMKKRNVEFCGDLNFFITKNGMHETPPIYKNHANLSSTKQNINHIRFIAIKSSNYCSKITI